MERIENKIEKRNNKKNVQKKVLMVAGLALLLGFVGYTGGTTYAKYVTSTEVPATTATVAKWGVVITADTGANGFGKNYTGGTIVSTTGVGVSASEQVVAPGTKGSFTFSIAGQPEVSGEITFDFEDGYKDVYYGDYHPIVWTFGSQTGTLKEIVTHIEGLSTEFAPGTDLAKSYTLSWEWKFDNSALNSNADEFDTYIANAVAGTGEVGTEEISTDLSFALTVSVEQTAK